MTFIIIINKDGKLQEKNVKKIDDDKLYAKAGFKVPDNFKIQTTWNNVKLKDETIFKNIVLYGKTVGVAGRENKYELPPPIDNTLFYGSIIITNKDEDSFLDLKLDSWNKIYESLFGGFEDIEDTEDEEEEEVIDSSKLDKNGYEKDGFIVSDESELEYDSELSEEDYFD